MGLINIYNTVSNEHSQIKALGKIKDVLPDYDFSKCICIKAGEKINPEYVIKEDDVLYLRTVPGSSAAVAITIAVISVVVAGVAIGVSYQQSQEAKAQQEKAMRDSKNLSSAGTSLPFLRGCKNKSALGNPVQYVIGETYNSPYALTDGFYAIGGTDGNKQYWNAVLSAGYKGQVFEKLYCGNELVQEWSDTTPQTCAYGTKEGTLYHDPENIIEITQDGSFKNNYFRQKVKGTLVGTELKNEYDEQRDKNKEYLVKQCELNTSKVEVCIEFPSLRAYDTDLETWVEKPVVVTPEWSNGDKNADGSIKWYTTGFKFESSKTATWRQANSDTIQTLIDAGKLEKNTKYAPKILYTSKSDDVRVESQGKNSLQSDKVYYLEDQTFENTIQRNSSNTIRFVAEKEFTAEECYGKTISVRLSRDMKAEKNTQEDCYFKYMNCYCYDAAKSTANKLEPCLVYENQDELALIGLRFIANESTKDVLDEMNFISYAIAPGFTNTGVITAEVENRNPVSWIYKILTSDTHKHSQYSFSEININSFYTAWKFCEDNKLYVDGIVTTAIKKRDLITKLCSVINATLFYNSDGLLEIVIDKAESTPVALLNAENIKSITYAKELNRKPTGIKLSFTNHESWQIDTRYVMIDGSDQHDEDDIITEKSVELVTDPTFIYKIGQRTAREQVLQPITLTADVGREGDYYPLYSLVLVQLQQLRQGLQSSIITSVNKNNSGAIIGITISDEVQLSSNQSYGVVIQAISSAGTALFYRAVTGDEKTRTLMFSESITGDIVPVIGNNISFGLLNNDGSFDKVTNKYKIYGLSRNGNEGVKLTLKPYNEALYEFGTIPEFKSNLTPSQNKGSQVPTVTQTQLQQTVDNLRTITNIENYYCLSTSGTIAPDKSYFSKTVPTMTSDKRFLWSYTKYTYKDGTTKDTSIILSGAYGEQGEPGSGYRLDLSPDSTTIFANQNGTATIPSVQFGAYLFYDTQELTSQSTFKAYINDVEVGTWSGSVVTIPTNKLSSDTTQIKIVANYQTNSRTAFCSVTKVYGNTFYQLLPSTQNIKVQKDGTITPSLVTITRQKITNTGYYQASEEEGVIYGRLVPGGELQKIGYYEVKSSDTYDNTKQYCTEFKPFLLGVETDPNSGADIVISDEDGNALIFFTRK